MSHLKRTLSERERRETEPTCRSIIVGSKWDLPGSLPRRQPVGSSDFRRWQASRILHRCWPERSMTISVPLHSRARPNRASISRCTLLTPKAKRTDTGFSSRLPTVRESPMSRSRSCSCPAWRSIARAAGLVLGPATTTASWADSIGRSCALECPTGLLSTTFQPMNTTCL